MIRSEYETGDAVVVLETGEQGWVIRATAGEYGVVVVLLDSGEQAFEPHEVRRWGVL